MKKVLAIALAMLLVVSSFVFASAAEDATITVATITNPVKAGDTVRVPVTISRYANAYATIMISAPTFDSTKLTFVGFEESETNFTGAYKEIGEDFGLLATPTSDESADDVEGGEVCVLVFTAKEDITKMTAISVNAIEVTGYSKGSADSWVEFKTLSTAVVDGGIEGFEPEVSTPDNIEDADITVTVDTVKGPIAEGEEVALSISTTEWTNAYSSITLVVKYNKTLLTLDYLEKSSTGVTGGLEVTNEEEGFYTLIATVNSDREASKLQGGEICIAYFYALTDINESTSVTVTADIYGYTNGSADNWVSNHKLAANVVAGGIEVEVEPTYDVDATVTTLAQNVEANTEVKIPVTIGENENGYGAIEVKDLVYDNTVLEFVGFDRSATDFQLGSAMDVTNGETFSMLLPASPSERDLVKGGEICIIKFKTKVDVDFDVAVSATVTAEAFVNDIDVAPLSVRVIPGGIDGHEHAAAPDAEYKYDETNHWFECGTEGCGVIIDKAPHEGGKATCSAKAECSVCGAEYGDFDKANHEGETEVRDEVAADCGNAGYTGDTYCLGCGEMIDEGETIPATGAHTGGTATCCAKAECSVCGAEYGDFDKDNHEGETEVRDYVAADCGNAGYTGDTYCLGCGEKIASGEVIPATGNHTGGTATCCTKATCGVCGAEYGGYNAENHEGETEVRDDVAADCGNDGYTGDTYCLGCGEKIASGDVILATGNHTGGEATCVNKAECSVCGQQYGELDEDNHKNTEIRDENSNYTGDLWCKDCETKLEEGSIITLYGDANEDGDVNAFDAMLIAQYYVGRDVEINLILADVSGDGKINAIDAMLISQYYAGLITEFPAVNK